MARITKKFTRATCVVLAIVGVGVLGLQASASAAPSGAVRAAGAARPSFSGPTAVLEQYQWLTASPTSNMPAACISKNVYLKADTYDFAAYVWEYAVIEHPTIPAGTYHWLVCITPEQQPVDDYTGYWASAQVSSLSSSFHTEAFSDLPPPPADGYYWWGSWLSPW